jgi:urease gamma subunit
VPRASVNLDPGDKKDLKTLPGAWVQLRRMSYGAKLTRMGLVGKMSVEMRKQSRGGARGQMEMMQRAATIFDFQQCVVDHNLYADDAETIKMNLTTEHDIISLDPQVGEEISTLIDNLNNFEETEEALESGNSSTASEPQ